MSKNETYYSADLTIPIVEVYASSKEEADAIISEFIDAIAPIMADKIRWNSVDWNVELNTFNQEKEVWEVTA